MAAPAVPGARATLDFFGAQANARRRTRWLVLSFALSLAGVIAVIYGVLLIVEGAAVPSLMAASISGVAVEPPLALFQPQLLLGVTVGVTAVVGLGSAYHAMRLAAGGGEAVAQMLGGTLIDRSTKDPSQQRLIHVAEEMAIAAGLPVPRLYVLEREGHINAFAAGYTPGHSVVAVTRGALDQLTRDELQGVVAHELSHVLNADTRVDLRLMAAVGGLTVLALIGRIIISHARWSRKGNGLVLIGLAFTVAGGIGLLCGKLVRYAVARQREWLADASAVQFTRHPEGLAGALRKIAAEGSAIVNPHASEAAHLFFASQSAGFLAGLFSTHPPIEERIQRLAPFAATPQPRERRPLGTSLEQPGALQGRPGTGPIPPNEVVAATVGLALIGAFDRKPPVPTVTTRPAPAHVAHAVGLLDRLAPELTAAAREPFGARVIACALLLDGTPAMRSLQLAYLDRNDSRLRVEVERLAPFVDAVARADRMALLGLALPALDALSPGQRTALGADLRALAAADETVTTFELAIRRTVLRRLARSSGVPPRVQLRTLDEALPECLELLSILARVGSRNETAAQAALDTGARTLGIRTTWRLPMSHQSGVGRLDATLTRLDEAAPEVKARILGACEATVLADAQVTIEEAELVRAISAALGLAVPPVLDVQDFKDESVLTNRFG